MTLRLDGYHLTIEKVVEVATKKRRVQLDAAAMRRVERSSDFIRREVESGHIIYGVTTGFGPNADTVIAQADAERLQEKLLLSHACGVGAPFDQATTRAIMLIRLNTLLRGHSGIRPKVVRLLQTFLNYNVLPVIPSQGSVGASGDLCPLSHMALPLFGAGYVSFNGKQWRTEDWLKSLEAQHINQQIAQKNEAHLANDQQPEALMQAVPLTYKEGLALNNGTAVMAALGALGVWQAEHLLKTAVRSAAMAFEALLARRQAFEHPLHAVRLHTGQVQVARWLRELFADGNMVGLEKQTILQAIHTPSANMPERPRWRAVPKLEEIAHKKNTPQDAYSVRCTPQVLGASWDAVQYVRGVVTNELNAVVDNPIIFLPEQELPDGTQIAECAVLSGGNFHGQAVAMALDHLKIAVAEIGNLAERQINKLLDRATNDGLPAFLAENAGLDSGLMIPQYVAAALVSENKVLAHPASVDSIPTSANQEDHVSMGPIAGRQALEMLENVRKILAIHLLTARQALAMRIKQFDGVLALQPSAASRQLVTRLEAVGITYCQEDRLLYNDIQAILQHWEAITAD